MTNDGEFLVRTTSLLARPGASAAHSVGELSVLLSSFERSLRAANKSPNTIEVYVMPSAS